MAALGHEIKITSTQITFLTAAPLGKAASLHHSWSLRCPRENRACCLIYSPSQGVPPRLLSEGIQDSCMAPTLAVR